MDYLHSLLLELARKYGWNLEAWAIFSNHYHFIAQSPLEAERQYFEASLNLAQAQANRFADTAALFQALGG
ncbi:MAG: hypothetical protein ACXWM7_00200 [Parachlamydiaceae bacterium]